MKKSFLILNLLFILFSFSSCKKPEEINVEDGFQVIFIDVENSSDGKIHYDGEKNDNTLGNSAAKPSDCYLIKTGNTEILVDAGYQYHVPQGSAVKERISKIYKENVINKINKYCTDGVLEYLIVTHGDYDHIIGLIVEDGILDYFYKSTDKKIGTIIDFDSDLVRYLSQPEGNRLYPSGYNNFFSDSALDLVINPYRQLRDRLVAEKGTKHIPAASFFKNFDLLKDNTINAMPTDMLKKYYVTDKNGSITDTLNKSIIPNFRYFSENYIYSNTYDNFTSPANDLFIEFVSPYENVDLSFGSLKENNDRYYFSIQLENGVELRILYNWYYDHFFQSFIQNDFDSKIHNNISVCFSVNDNQGKFVSFGDLGTGETGMINYYKDTNVLTKVSCFKASHHGSISNGENSKDLFELMKADVVIIPGVAQINRDILTNNNLITDPIFNGLKSTPTVKLQFFNNVFSGNLSTEIYFTHIARKLKDVNGFQFVSSTFYGDIIVHIVNTSIDVDCTCKGNIEGYVTSQSEELQYFVFSNCFGDEMLSFEDTDYYDLIYNKNGKRDEE